MFRFLITWLFICLSTCVSTDSKSETDYNVCIGNSNACQNGVWFSCGTSIEQAAEAVCTTSTTSGQTKGQYTIKLNSVRAGGQCGYSFFTVTCK